MGFESGEMTIYQIAAVCHEANRAFCEVMGDFSQVHWAFAPEWQRESAVEGVLFNLRNPDAPASSSHDCWLAQKQATGWKFGPVKDEAKKEHPCYVPYEELPEAQKAKDHLFKGVVAAFRPLVAGSWG
jgi:hypothetical protein